MKYAIFCDLENTLSFDGIISQDDIDSIKFLKKKGHKFYINTEKPIRCIKGFHENYPNLCDGYILMNGSLILDQNFEVIHKKTIDIKYMNDIFRKLNCTEFVIETSKKGYYKSKIHNSQMYTDCSLIEDKIVILKDVCQIHVSLENCDLSIYKMKRIFKNYPISLYDDNLFVDIVNFECSKGKAICNIENKLDYITVAIGDSVNDMSMFERCEYSFVIGNKIKIGDFKNYKNVKQILDILMD